MLLLHSSLLSPHLTSIFENDMFLCSVNSTTEHIKLLAINLVKHAKNHLLKCYKNIFLVLVSWYGGKYKYHFKVEREIRVIQFSLLV